MNVELPFRISLFLIGLLLYAIRFYYIGLTARSGDKVTRKGTGKEGTLAIVSVSLLTMSLPVLYIFAPGWIGWAGLPMPVSLRWIGVGLLFISTLMLLWVHHTLGKNYDMQGVIKEHQTLVIMGPYRRVRHPMYSILSLAGFATFLISANWFIGIVLLAYFTLVVSLVGKEEATLIERFGDKYRAYMQHTGRFLPRVVLRK